MQVCTRTCMYVCICARVFHMNILVHTCTYTCMHACTHAHTCTHTHTHIHTYIHAISQHASPMIQLLAHRTHDKHGEDEDPETDMINLAIVALLEAGQKHHIIAESIPTFAWAKPISGKLFEFELQQIDAFCGMMRLGGLALRGSEAQVQPVCRKSGDGKRELNMAVIDDSLEELD